MSGRGDETDRTGSRAMALKSVGAGQSREEAVVLWVAGDDGEHRRVPISERLALSLMRQLATVIEARS